MKIKFYKPMELKYGSIVLFVKNVEISKRFYMDILDQKIQFDFNKNVTFENGISIWEPIQGHIISKSLVTGTTANPIEIYFETEDLLLIFNKIKSSGIKFLHEIIEEPWGQRTIRFFDPDNHLIEIGESMRQFVCRFYDQGLTIDQVSERTSVPVDEIKRLIKKK